MCQVPGVLGRRGREKSGESKRDEWSASGANKRERKKMYAFFYQQGGPWREREGFISRSSQSRSGGKKKGGGERDRERGAGKHERREHSKYQI